jgi:hypothetical protein
LERQTPWRKSKGAAEMGHIYTTLSGRIHSSHQIGDATVVLATDILTTEESLGVGALLYGFVPIEFHPETLFRREYICPNHHGSVANLMRRVDAPRQSRINVTHLCRNLALSPRCLPLHTPSDVRLRLHEPLQYSYRHPARGLQA